MPPFKTTYRVSWVDTDAAQVVHFSNYFRIFERAEEEMFAKLGLSFDEVRRKFDIWLPRVEALCKFKAPARFGDTLEVYLTVAEIMDKAVKYTFQIVNQKSEQEVAEGYVVIVVADRKSGHATSIPEELAKKLETYKMPEPPQRR
jgi:acyl-CoA thioester hydrolase